MMYSLNDLIKRQWALTGLKLDVKDQAPNTINDLVSSFNGDTMVVYAGGSEGTIYDDPSVNWIFRALHDLEHIKLGADFSPKGELLVETVQLLKLNDVHRAIVRGEVSGQVAYFEKNGCFPSDQRAFNNLFTGKEYF